MLSWEAFKHHLEPIFFVNGLIALPSGSQEGARKKKIKQCCYIYWNSIEAKL